MVGEIPTRAVNLHGGKYYRMTLPKEYIDDVTEKIKKQDWDSETDLSRFLEEGERDEYLGELLIKQAGDYLLLGPPLRDLEVTVTNEYLIGKPADEDELPVREFELPGDLQALVYANSEPDDKPMLDRYIEKILQSMAMSGVSEVSINAPESLDNFKWDLIEAFDAQDNGQGIEIDMNADDIEGSSIHFEEGRGIDALIEPVQRTMNISLVRPLVEANEIYEGPRDSDQRSTFIQKNNRMKQNKTDDEMDNRFTQTIRHAGDIIHNLRVHQYPEALATLFIGKYCETTIDLTGRVVESLKRMEEEFGEEDESVIEFEAKLSQILSNEPQFHSHLAEIAEKSYHGEVGPPEYQSELDTYLDRIEILDEIRKGGCLDNPSDHGYQFGIRVGEVSTLVERLVRIPRSMSLVGITIDGISSVYNL